nr:carcinoembryonic antigen-related cell adhesion molecule 5-like [Misgurnus anguillicaudatus]
MLDCCYAIIGYYPNYNDGLRINVTENLKPVVSVDPDTQLFRGETVTLRCDIQDTRDTEWTYSWTVEKTNNRNIIAQCNTQECKINNIQQTDSGKYTCRGKIREHNTEMSDSVTLTVSSEIKPKPKLTSDTEGSVLTGNTVTLKCHIDQSTGWKFYWYNNTQNTEKTTTDTNSYKIHSVKVSDGGQYWCRAGRGKPDYYTDYSDGLWINVTENLKPVVSVYPDKQLFRGETVTLRCDIQNTGDTEWTYSWTVKKTQTSNIITQCNTQECKITKIQQNDSGKYTCRGKIRKQNTMMSDAVTLTVSSDKRPTVLSVSPQQWLTEGDSVTLMCEVRSSSTGWTFSWFTLQSPSSVNKDVNHELVSNRSRGSKGNYTVGSVTVKHTGVYMCSAERGDPVYHTKYSNRKILWITGVSPSVSLIIRPNRSQHFSSESLSLSCEDHSNSTGWTVRRYTDKLKPCSSSDWRSTGTTSTCTIRSLNTSDTGVYWCQSESGEKLHPVNISVHIVDVILDSPVHPVTEGDPLTLRCLYRDKNSSNLRAEFYKDGSVVQNQTTGDMMIIPTVSKSHEGFYYCKYPEKQESPKSWISVRASSFLSPGLIIGVGAGLGVMFLIIFLVILGIYKNRKAVSQNIRQTSDQKQSEDDPLQSGDAHIYDSVDSTDNKDTSAVTQAGPSDVLYSQVSFKKKLKKKDNVSEDADVTYADIELKPKKEMKKKKEKKGSTSEGGDALYAQVNKKSGKVASGSDDVTYAQIKLKPI